MGREWERPLPGKRGGRLLFPSAAAHLQHAGDKRKDEDAGGLERIGVALVAGSGVTELRRDRGHLVVLVELVFGIGQDLLQAAGVGAGIGAAQLLLNAP